MAKSSVIRPTAEDKKAVGKIVELAKKAGIDIGGGRVRRTSSRFCLGVEHGDYNGTELFGVAPTVLSGWPISRLIHRGCGFTAAISPTTE